MKTKYTYFAIGNEVFYNSGKFCIRIHVNNDFPVIEYLEDHTIQYYNKTWRKHIVEIGKITFERRFKEILELIKNKIEL